MRTRFSPSCLVVTALGAIVTLPLAVPAQVSYEVAPYVGLYLPLGAMLQPVPPSPGFSGSGQTVTQRTTLALGGHVTAWLSHRVGLEGSWMYAPSGVDMTCGDPNGCPRGGRVLGGSVKVVVPLTFVSILRAVHVGGGIGVVDHGGPAYNDVAGTTSAAPTVGAGVALKVAGPMLLRVDAEDSWFRPQLGVQGCIHVDAVCRAVQGSVPGVQHDLILSVGLLVTTDPR